MIEGAIIFAAGLAIGFILGRLRRSPVTVETICGCDHHLSMHDPATGRCNEVVHKWMLPNGELQTRKCDCLRYVGPESINQPFTHPGYTMAVTPQQIQAPNEEEPTT